MKVRIRYGLKRVIRPDANILNADWARTGAPIPVSPEDEDEFAAWLVFVGLTRRQWDKLPASRRG